MKFYSISPVKSTLPTFVWQRFSWYLKHDRLLAHFLLVNRQGGEMNGRKAKQI